MSEAACGSLLLSSPSIFFAMLGLALAMFAIALLASAVVRLMGIEAAYSMLPCQQKNGTISECLAAKSCKGRQSRFCARDSGHIGVLGELRCVVECDGPIDMRKWTERLDDSLSDSLRIPGGNPATDS